MAAAEAEGERLRAEELRLYGILPQGAGIQRQGVTHVEMIRAKQALPGLSTAIENNMLVLDDLRVRLRTAMAIRDAEVRAAFTPRKLAVGARVDDVRVWG